MGATIRRRNSVAVGIEKAVGIGGPAGGPLAGAMRADLAGAAGENVGMDEGGVCKRFGQIVLEPIGEMERGLFGHLFDAAKEFLGARPADFDAAEQISLRTRHLENALGSEVRLCPDDFRVGPKPDLGAAAVWRLASILQFGLRLAAFESHPGKTQRARDPHS